MPVSQFHARMMMSSTNDGMHQQGGLARSGKKVVLVKKVIRTIRKSTGEVVSFSTSQSTTNNDDEDSAMSTAAHIQASRKSSNNAQNASMRQMASEYKYPMVEEKQQSPVVLMQQRTARQAPGSGRLNDESAADRQAMERSFTSQRSSAFRSSPNDKGRSVVIEAINEGNGDDKLSRHSIHTLNQTSPSRFHADADADALDADARANTFLTDKRPTEQAMVSDERGLDMSDSKRPSEQQAKPAQPQPLPQPLPFSSLTFIRLSSDEDVKGREEKSARQAERVRVLQMLSKHRSKLLEAEKARWMARWAEEETEAKKATGMGETEARRENHQGGAECGQQSQNSYASANIKISESNIGRQ